jgi:hypothetical protein
LKIFQQTLIYFFQSSFDFKILIAIMIAIENLIRINQTLIKKTIREFTFPDPSSRKCPGSPGSCAAHPAGAGYMCFMNREWPVSPAP